MICLVLYIIYLLTLLINKLHVSPVYLLGLVVAVSALFLFRTAVASLLVVVIVVTFMLSRYRGSFLLSIAIGALSFGLVTFVMYHVGEIEFVKTRIASAETVGVQRATYLFGGGDLSVYEWKIRDLALTPIYVTVAFIGPFPSMVEVPLRFDTSHDDHYYRMAGSIIWNLLAFFSVVGLYRTIRVRLIRGFPLWAFTIGYMYIMIVTVTFTRDRFAYLSMPLLLATAAVGLVSVRGTKYWVVYVLVLVAATIVWNGLRLAIRGI